MPEGEIQEIKAAEQTYTINQQHIICNESGQEIGIALTTNNEAEFLYFVKSDDFSILYYWDISADERDISGTILFAHKAEDDTLRVYLLSKTSNDYWYIDETSRMEYVGRSYDDLPQGARKDFALLLRQQQEQMAL